MKKALKVMKVSLCIVVIAICMTILAAWINHRINLSKENKVFVPNGQMIKVNGHNMHIYTEGNGDIPLVFMSGGGTSSPVLDFKSLYSLLSNKYKIVVVEKFGYGFSDVVDVQRDIDSILSDTRKALSVAGIKGPYILFPHSMSGIEALYWAQKYPEEVKGIVGLDMSVPEAYENYKINMPLIKLGAAAANIGVTRLIPGVAESDAIKYGTLTDKEKILYKAVFYRRTGTLTMINEVKEVKSNAKKVAQLPLPNAPILIFSSNGSGTGWNESDWRSFQKNAISKFKNGQLIELNCTHYVHDIEYKKIADASVKFIEDIKNK